jgi:magnesium transporter
MSSVQEFLKTLNPLHKSDIQNAEHSSYFFKTSDYSLLIMRLFTLRDDGLYGVSTPYIITKDMLLHYQRDTKVFEPLSSRHVSLSESISYQLQKSEDLMMYYIQEIDKLEDDLYMRKLSPIFLDVWFDLKKDIARMDRILERANEALDIYIEEYHEEENFPIHSFSNIIEHLQRYQRTASLHSNKLDTLYNYYTSLKNEKMNRHIYTLTILSGIFLPLNLIVGFFGMNTQGLFFSEDASGTWHVTMILLFVFLLFILFVPLAGYIERYILRKLLGRFNLYNSLINNIKKITDFSGK